MTFAALPRPVSKFDVLVHTQAQVRAHIPRRCQRNLLQHPQATATRRCLSRYCVECEVCCRQKDSQRRAARTRCNCISPGQYASDKSSRESCPLCFGTTQVQCSACKGNGRLTKAGYHTRNPVNAAKIVGTPLLSLDSRSSWHI